MARAAQGRARPATRQDRSQPRVPAPEFSRLVRLSQIEGQALVCEIAAEEAERAALVRRFDLLSLDRLTATVEVYPEDSSGTLRVTGRFVADVTQACVVTLDPVAAHLDEAFEMRFTTDPEVLDAEIGREAPGEIEIVPEAEDPPEPIHGGAIDIGEAVVQQFAVALDPYPRAPDASIEALDAEGTIDAAPPPSPFAILAQRRGRGE